MTTTAPIGDRSRDGGDRRRPMTSAEHVRHGRRVDRLDAAAEAAAADVRRIVTAMPGCPDAVARRLAAMSPRQIEVLGGRMAASPQATDDLREALARLAATVDRLEEGR